MQGGGGVKPVVWHSNYSRYIRDKLTFHVIKLKVVGNFFQYFPRVYLDGSLQPLCTGVDAKIRQ